MLTLLSPIRVRVGLEVLVLVEIGFLFLVLSPRVDVYISTGRATACSQRKSERNKEESKDSHDTGLWQSNPFLRVSVQSVVRNVAGVSDRSDHQELS